MLIDIHCHLNDKRIDLDKVMNNAKKNNVKVVHSVVNPKNAEKSLELKKKYKFEMMFGLHPIHVKEYGDEEIDKYLNFIKKNKKEVIGIGEIGIDKHHIQDNKEIEECKIVFEKLLKLAEELKLPVLIHSWDAEKDCIDILEKYNLKVILHCFNGKRELIFRVKDKYYFTVPTSIVKSKHFRKLVKWVNISRLLTETDAPYLSPFPGLNEPSFVTEAIRKIADIKKITEEEVIKIIWMNYQNIFK